jgi:hypothetical protein
MSMHDWDTHAELAAIQDRIRSMTDAEKARFTSDWVSWVDFGGKAVDFTQATGKILSEGDHTGDSPGGKDSVPAVRRLSDFSDLKFFSLGPAYRFVGINFDILGEFRKLVGYEGPRVVLNFSKPVMTGLDDWDYIIEGVHEDAYPALVEFMQTQTVKRDSSKEYWEFRYTELLVHDPCGVDRNDLSDTDHKAILGVFLPSGSPYQVKASLATHPVAFSKKVPEPSVLAAASKLYNDTFG